MIPYGRQNISDDDIAEVVNVLKSDYLTQGPLVPVFEKEICEYVDVDFAVATNSATSALHLACLALGVGKGDIVWTTPITFVASANCALYCGAEVDFVDIEPESNNISVAELERKLILAKQNGRLPKVVIPVHLSGNPCDMEAIHNLGLQYGFKIIEDASHAIGGKYKSKKIGNCAYSDICIFSFHPVKIITTGEGGMALTNNVELAILMQRLRSHGITRDPKEMSQIPDGSWYYEQLELGFNYRMTDIQAALGISQLKKIDEFLEQRNKIAHKYNELLSGQSLTLPIVNEEDYSAFHLYIIRVKSTRDKNQVKLFEILRANGIMVNLHYIPVYRHPFYKKMGFESKDYPASESYYSEAISLPIFPGLSDKQIELICSIIKSPSLNHQTLF